MIDHTEQDATDSHDEFLRHVRRASRAVLGNSDTGREVERICDEHRQARELILTDRSGGALVIAIVGATGQGKSWLVRQIVRESASASLIRSGDKVDQATEQLVWVGPTPPADLDNRFEQFVHVAREDLEDIGWPYLVVDAPGATDERQAIADVARRALSLASALVLVVRRDQIRGKTPGSLAVASEGTIVIPVINTVGSRDAELDADTDAFLANLRAAAPGSIIARAMHIDDFAVTEGDESEVGAAAARELMNRVKTELENNPDSDRRKNARLAALDARFRAALSGLLSDKLPGLTTAVNRLNDEATKLPSEVAHTLIGPQGPMQAAVRSRLRLKLLTQTGAIWFPYRTLLGTLNLTHGAWDRVLLSLSGSLPSLVGTIWTSTQSLLSDRSANSELKDGLQRRSAAAVTDRLGPLAAQFRDELAILRREDEGAAATGNSPTRYEANMASLAGIDALEEQSQTIFEDAIEQHSISSFSSTLMALIGTLIFWALMAGPFVALYSEYLTASFQSLTGGEPSMDQFPKPEFATVLTSLLLSLLPTAVFAMIALSISQSKSRVGAAEKQIREQHDRAIETLQRDRILRLRWDDPLLSDAELLVSAGQRRIG